MPNSIDRRLPPGSRRLNLVEYIFNNMYLHTGPSIVLQVYDDEIPSINSADHSTQFAGLVYILARQ